MIEEIQCDIFSSGSASPSTGMSGIYIPGRCVGKYISAIGRSIEVIDPSGVTVEVIKPVNRNT